MRKNAGFTIIELMIVIGIIGLVTAISIPNIMGWMSDRKLNSSTREILGTLQVARLKAVKENSRVVVDFDLPGNQVIAFVDNGEGGGVAANWTRDGSERIIARAKAAPGVDLHDITFDDGVLGFDPRGTLLLIGGFLAINEEIHLKNENLSYKGVRLAMMGNPVMISSSNGTYWD